MSELFTTSGEKDGNVVTPTPQLQGLFLPGIDNPLAGDGFGIVTPWGGGSGTRKYNDYGISSSVSNQSTQLYDLASGLVPAEGGGVTYNFEGLIGPQGLPGVAGTTLILHEYTGLNSNFLTALPHNLNLIEDLGTAVDQMIYTSAYDAYTSEVVTFTERQPAGDADRNWLRVASDSDGSHLIAGADSERLYTSADYGVNWTERQPAGDATKRWMSVASDADGSHLIAGIGGPSGGRLYTSDDYGVTWTERQPAGDVDRQWDTAASDDDGSHLIVAAYNGRVYMSADYGVNWTERQPAGDVNQNWWSVASDSDGSNIIIGAIAGRLYTSANAGVGWTERRPIGDIAGNWRGVASDADGSNLIVGASNYRLYTSANAGVGWTERRPAGDISQNWETVASDSDGSHLIAGVQGKRLYISVDSGVNWGEKQPAGDVDIDWYDVACDSDGSHLIVGAYSGRLYTGVSGTYGEATWAETTITSAGRALLDDATAAAQRTTLGLAIGTNVQAWDAGLDSLAALTYVSDSFIKVTAENTYAIRTIAETKTDLSLNLVENTAHSTDAHTMTIDGRDVSVDGTKLDGIEALADVTATYETSHALVLVDGDFGSAGLMNTDGAGAYSIKAIGTDVQAYHANLAAIAGGTWAGAASITTLGTIATVGNITIADGGTIGPAALPLIKFNETLGRLQIQNTDGLLELRNVLTDTTNKSGRVVVSHYDNTEEPMYVFGAVSTAADNFFAMGGGNAAGNAATRIQFFAAADTITVTGTKRMEINSTHIEFESDLKIKEQASASVDIAAYGQIWVKTAIPNELWFTDDAGGDFQLSGVATGVLNHSFVYDPPDIANGAEASTGVTVTGAAFGDFVLVSFSANVFDLVLTGEVTSTNVVTVVFANNTGAARDLASGTVYIRVLKK